MRRAETGAEPLLSIVIPAYNEQDNIKRGVLQQAVDYLAGQTYGWELIIVDDGSDDDTPGLIKQFCKEVPQVRLIHNHHCGKAHSVMVGMLAARGQYLMFMDLDLATSLNHIEDALKSLQRDTDVVIASREARGAVRIGSPWMRRFLGKGFNLLIQALLLPGINDTQCGFKAFRKDVAQELFRKLVVFASPSDNVEGPRVTAFDVELLVLARKRGYSVKQIPVTWRYVRTSRVRPVIESYRMFKEVIQVWLNKMRGKYNPDSGGS